MNNEFIIPLNGLAAGETKFSWQAGKEFFDSFENSEILDAELQIEASVEKLGRYIGVDCDIQGEVTVECDRCLEDLDLPIDVEIRLSVKYGSEDSSEDHQEGEREVIFIPADDAQMNMGQIIYDYVCLSLPMQRVHAPGECNPAAMRYFDAHQESISEDQEGENPFAALKNMFV